MPQDRNTPRQRPLYNDGVVEDFTSPFLVTAAVLCFIALVAISAMFGFALALVCAWLANKALDQFMQSQETR